METLPLRNPRLVAIVLLMILTAGISALLAIGRQEDPTITNLFATVTTIYPGADPGRVEALVSAKIEEELKTIAEVDVVSSTSTTGVSVVSVELDETIPDARIEETWSRVRDALDDAARLFPPGVLSPEFDSDGAGAYAAIVAVVARGEGVTTPMLARQAEILADRLRSVDGTRLVDLFGVPEEEVLVEVDPAAAATLGLSADEISAAIGAADAKVRAGRLSAPGADLVLEVGGEIAALDRLRSVILRRDADGRATYLGDLARIDRGPADPPAELALHQGRPAVLVAARVAEGRQVDAWAERIRAVVEEAGPSMPKSIALEPVFDQSVYTLERLGELAVNLLIGVVLVIAVLVVTLGLRPALIVALVLPLVGLASLASLNALGIPIHQMSVTGLIVALGLVVDAAIVMVDEVARRRTAGETATTAVRGAVRRLFMPLMASTATTMLAFVPMILLPGPAGDFVGSIAVAVVVMLAWSFAVAVVVTPALAGWWIGARPNDGRVGPGRRLFRWSLALAARNPVRALLVGLVLPVIGFASLPTLEAQFFPGVDRDQFTIEIELAEGTAIGETRRVAEAIDGVIRSDPGIDGASWVIGRSAPAFYYNVVSDRRSEPAFAMALVSTASPAETERLVPALQRDLSAAFPEARVLVRGLVQGPPVDAPVEVRLVGPDVGVLRERGEEARRIVAGVPGVTLVRASLSGGAPKVLLVPDEAKVRLAGLDLGSVARQIEAALEGVTGGSMLEGTEELPVRVRFGDGVRGDLDAIADLPLLPPGSAAAAAAGDYPAMPLSAVADLVVTPGGSPITRRNGERTNTVQAFVERGILPETTLAATRVALEQSGFVVPAGYRIEIGGDSDARSSTLQSLLAPLGLIASLSLGVVVLTFNSFRLALVTFTVGGLAAGLSILSLALFGYPFGIIAIIGVIGSVGVSVNAAIVILSALQEDPRASAGDADAVAAVVAGASRHVVSTTVTTFGGFLPLLLAGGGFWPPFAMAIAGGVLLSSLVSLWFAPAAFVLVRPGRRPAEETPSARPPEPQMPSIRTSKMVGQGSAAPSPQRQQRSSADAGA